MSETVLIGCEEGNIPCDRCSGTGNLIKDWDRYISAKTTEEIEDCESDCPDCSGYGRFKAETPSPPEKPLVPAPANPSGKETQEFTLRAMATNYSDGHSWDHLDGEVCKKAADEISSLRAMLFPYADATEISGVSWDGKYLIGDKTSIKFFHEMKNRGEQIDVYRRAYDERISASEAQISALKSRIQGLEEAGQAYVSSVSGEPEKDCWDTEDGKEAPAAERFASDWAWKAYDDKKQQAFDALRAALNKDEKHD